MGCRGDPPDLRWWSAPTRGEHRKIFPRARSMPTCTRPPSFRSSHSRPTRDASSTTTTPASWFNSKGSAPAWLGANLLPSRGGTESRVVPVSTSRPSFRRVPPEPTACLVDHSINPEFNSVAPCQSPGSPSSPVTFKSRHGGGKGRGRGKGRGPFSAQGRPEGY